MNTAEVDKLGAKPLEPELALIDKLNDKKQLAALNLELEHRFGDGHLLNLGVQQDQVDSSKQIIGTGQGGLTLPDRDYYLNDDERSRTLRDEYVAPRHEDVCAAWRSHGQGYRRGRRRSAH